MADLHHHDNHESGGPRHTLKTTQGHRHGHGHSHGHDHSHANARIGWAFFLNLAFTVIEFVGGLLTNSTAIMADAVHDLGDCIAIGLSWWLQKVSGRAASGEFTYGYRRFSLLGALINGLILVVGSVWVLLEAIPRLQNPVMPHTEGMIGLAVLGIAVNGYAALRLREGKTLNERTLNWHLLEDVLSWGAILVVAVVLQFVHWPILDPLMSIAFSLFILLNVVRNLKTTLHLFFQGSPDGQTREAVENRLRALAGVGDLHHLHFWSLDGEHHVLTAHVLLDRMMSIPEQQELKRTVAEALAEFQITHTTIELELPDERCRDSRGSGKSC